MLISITLDFKPYWERNKKTIQKQIASIDKDVEIKF